MKRTSIPVLICLAIPCAACHGGTSSKPIGESAIAPQQRSLPAKRDHCLADERVVFSCRLPQSSVSICALQESGGASLGIHYREGATGKPELVFTTENAKPGSFMRSHLRFAGGTGGYAYSFVVEDAKYVVYAISGAHDVQRAGVVIEPLEESKQAHDQRCEPGSLVETPDMDLIKRTLSFPEDPVIEREGLPASSN